MRIGIDCRLSGSKHAGIGRYIEHLALELPRLAPEVEWIFFYSESGQLSSVEQYTNVKLVHVPIRHYTLAEQWHLPPIVHQAHLDLLHIPHFNVPLRLSCPLVITIHDLLWHEFRGLDVTTLPAWQYWIKYLGYRLVTARAVRKALKILVPAETIKNTVTQYYPQAHAKIVVTKEGADRQFLQKNKAVNSGNRILVYLGSLYPHKNVAVILRALRKLDDYQLIIIGARSAFQNQVKMYGEKLGVSQRVIFAGYVADKEVATLLQTATALVQPSLSEGFGLTGVEAMAAKVPVIASDIPIFREIYQDSAAFFDPHDEQSLVQQVNLIAKPQRRLELIKKGEILARQYSWKKMAAETLAVYQQALSNKV